MAGDVLGSDWSGLNARLLGTIYAVDSSGFPLTDEPTVVSPITDANIEMTANWQSPFEQAGPDSKAPAIMSMLQLGTLESYVTAIFGKGSDKDSAVGSLARDITDFSQRAQGSTGMTKLNSTQVFTGAPPVKISMTLHFRAFKDPRSEVHSPADQLALWMLAQKLEPNSNLVAAAQGLKGGAGFLKSLLPSRAPQMVALRYGRFTFSPMVIENMGRPLNVPMTKDGDELHTTVQLTLATLTALDAGDWRRALQGKPTRLFSN